MLGGKNIDLEVARAVRGMGGPDFPSALSSLVRKITPFDNLIILIYDGEKNPVVVHREYRDPVVYLRMDDQYLVGAYVLDPFYQAHLKGTTRGIYRLLDIAPDQFKRTSYYNVYYRQTTLIDEIAIFARIKPAMTITACFGKDRTSGKKFRQADKRELESNEALLTALVETHWKDFAGRDSNLQTLPPLSQRLKTLLEKESGFKLSPRQAEVALYILRGHSSLSIGLNLGISRQTVKVFRRQLYARCNISSQAELFALMMPILVRLSADETNTDSSHI